MAQVKLTVNGIDFYIDEYVYDKNIQENKIYNLVWSGSLFFLTKEDYDIISRELKVLNSTSLLKDLMNEIEKPDDDKPEITYG